MKNTIPFLLILLFICGCRSDQDETISEIRAVYETLRIGSPDNQTKKFLSHNIEELNRFLESLSESRRKIRLDTEDVFDGYLVRFDKQGGHECVIFKMMNHEGGSVLQRFAEYEIRRITVLVKPKCQ